MCNIKTLPKFQTDRPKFSWSVRQVFSKILVLLVDTVLEGIYSTPQIEDIPEKIYINESVTIGVILKYIKGQPISNANKAITTEVTLPLIDDSSITSIVLQSEDGKYSVVFTPIRYRNHIVFIQVSGHHVSNSPVELKVDVKKFVTLEKTNTVSSYKPSVSDVIGISTGVYTRKKISP